MKKNQTDLSEYVFREITSNSLIADDKNQVNNSNENHGKIYVAFSGGLDSSVLLDLVVKLFEHGELGDKSRLRAIHVNHGLSLEADDWQNHCEKVCAGYGIKCISEIVSIDKNSGNIEHKARQQRYGVFESLLSKNDLLLLAHHQQDQGETLLLNLFKGHGPRGLSAMPMSRRLGLGKLLRPLLAVSKTDLESYAENWGLNWVEDDSNLQERFSRNFIRLKVVPLLSSRWTNIQAGLFRSAELNAEYESLVEDLARYDLKDFEAKIDDSEMRDRWGPFLPIPQLKDISLIRRKNLIRFWLRLNGVTMPSAVQMKRLEEDLLNARIDAQAVIRLKGDECNFELRSFQNKMYLVKADEGILKDKNERKEILEWDFAQNKKIKTPHGTLTLTESKKGLGLRKDIKSVEIHYRNGGERCRPNGRSHSQSLKKLLQEYRVPPWVRDNLPLLYFGGELVAVADIWVCEGFQSDDASSGTFLYERD